MKEQEHSTHLHSMRDKNLHYIRFQQTFEILHSVFIYQEVSPELLVLQQCSCCRQWSKDLILCHIHKANIGQTLHEGTFALIGRIGHIPQLEAWSRLQPCLKKNEWKEKKNKKQKNKMYIYIHTHMYVCMYVCMYVSVYVCMCVWGCAYVSVNYINKCGERCSWKPGG